MEQAQAVRKWNPLTEWRHVDIPWVRVNISKEDLARFTKRSNLKGLLHAVPFLLLMGAMGTLCYWAFSQRLWVLMGIALYFHGTFFGFFANGLHELSHNTVFRSKWLNVFFTTLFGLLAVEIAVTMTNQSVKTAIGAVFFLVALVFVYRSFYGMRIPEEK